LVIDADVRLGVARNFALYQGTAMRAAIDECMKTTILVAADDDRSIADIARPEIARPGDLGVQAEIIPGRAFEDPFLFLLVDFGVMVEAAT
jgi:hypothetical protein